MRDRGRGSRHPIQVLITLALIGISTSQLAWGPGASTPVLAMPIEAQRMFAALMLIGAVLVLLGAALPEPRAYWVELGGLVGCAVALTVYTLTLKSTVPQWNTSMGSGFGFVAIGCVLRIAWLTVLIVANFYPLMSRRIVRLYVTLRTALH